MPWLLVVLTLVFGAAIYGWWQKASNVVLSLAWLRFFACRFSRTRSILSSQGMVVDRRDYLRPVGSLCYLSNYSTNYTSRLVI